MEVFIIINLAGKYMQSYKEKHYYRGFRAGVIITGVVGFVLTLIIYN